MGTALPTAAIAQDLAGAVTRNSGDLMFVIRVDDILSRNMTILPRSILPFQSVVEARGGKITWGVMPHRFLETPNLDGTLERELRESAERGHEISQHGYTHICKECGQSNHEMYCSARGIQFSYGEQEELVRNGLTLLRERLGVTPTSFIPPGHIANETTFNVLKDNGIPYISTARNMGYLIDGFHNLPPDEEYTWSLDEPAYQSRLQQALRDVETAAGSTGVFNLMMHDPFTRSGFNNGITLAWMGELLDSLNARYDDRIRYMTLTEASHVLTGAATAIDPEPESARDLPDRILLAQNHPNPFNPSTTIRFELPQGGQARLTLHDLHGRLVRILADGPFSAGAHAVDVTLGDLPSGSYVYVLETGAGRTARLMTLLK